MNNQILNFIFFGIFALILSSCGEKKDTKKNDGIQSSTEFKKETKEKPQSKFVYSKADKKVKIELENNVEFLVAGQPTQANFLTENINDQLFMISGPGIKVNQYKNDNDYRFTITPKERNLVNGNLEIVVTEYFNKEEIFKHKFLVPVKTSTNKN